MRTVAVWRGACGRYGDRNPTVVSSWQLRIQLTTTLLSKGRKWATKSLLLWISIFKYWLRAHHLSLGGGQDLSVKCWDEVLLCSNHEPPKNSAPPLGGGGKEKREQGGRTGHLGSWIKHQGKMNCLVLWSRPNTLEAKPGSYCHSIFFAFDFSQFWLF